MLWIAVLIAMYAYREAQFIKIRRDRLVFRDLPPAFHGFTILHLSDLHCSYFGPRERRLCGLLGRMAADFVVCTGDYMRRKVTQKRRVEEALRQITQCIRSRFGTVGVLGNHDDRGIFGHVERAGIEILSGRTKRLTLGKDTVWIAGIDSQGLEETTRDLISVTSQIPDGTFRILLSHGPDAVRLARALGYGLILCGDTHAGQIRLPVIGALIVKSQLSRRYCWGIIREGSSILCISSGIGTCFLPLRLLCPPEVRILTLSSNSERRPT